MSGVVRIPAVRKGLNNQRMRIVQDAVIAALLGAAVELPSFLRTRRRCGYRAGCYQDYEGTVPFDAVYDRERVVEGLRRAGVCVVDTRSEGRAPELAGALWPTTASQLGPGGDVARRYDLRGGVWSLGGEEDCCTKLVVDTRRSLDLLTSVNAAFSSARRIRRAAHEVSRRLAAATGRAKEHAAVANGRLAPKDGGADTPTKSYRLRVPSGVTYVYACSLLLKNVKGSIMPTAARKR